VQTIKRKGKQVKKERSRRCHFFVCYDVLHVYTHHQTLARDQSVQHRRLINMQIRLIRDCDIFMRFSFVCQFSSVCVNKRHFIRVDKSIKHIFLKNVFFPAQISKHSKTCQKSEFVLKTRTFYLFLLWFLADIWSCLNRKLASWWNCDVLGILQYLSLLWGCGRGFNLSLTWDQPIANHNRPINSSQTQSSPAHMCSSSWSA